MPTVTGEIKQTTWVRLLDAHRATKQRPAALAGPWREPAYAYRNALLDLYADLYADGDVEAVYEQMEDALQAEHDRSMNEQYG